MQGHQDSHLHFLDTFTVLTFMFKSLIHLESIYVYGVRQGFMFILLYVLLSSFKATRFGFLHYLTIPVLCSGPLENLGPCLTSLPLNPAADPKLGEM